MAVYGPAHYVRSLLNSSDCQDLLTDNTSTLARWSEHLESLFNVDRTMQDTAIHCVPQLQLKPPTIVEIPGTIEQLWSNKAAGAGGFPSKV